MTHYSVEEELILLRPEEVRVFVGRDPLALWQWVVLLPRGERRVLAWDMRLLTRHPFGVGLEDGNRCRLRCCNRSCGLGSVMWRHGFFRR